MKKRKGGSVAMEFKGKPEVAAIEDALIVSLWHDPNLLGVVPHLTERHFPTWGVVFKHIKDAFLNGYRPIVSLLPPTLQFPFAELLDKTPPLDEAEVKVAAEQLVKQQTLSLLRRLGEMLVRKASDDADPSYLIGLVSHYIEQTVKWMGLEFKPLIKSAKRGDSRLMGEKVVLLVLKDEIAKWVDDLRKRTRMSDEKVIEGALYLLRVATSTELGRYYVTQALKASGFFMDATDKNKMKGWGGH